MNINLKNKKLIAVLVAAVIAIVGGVVWKINQKTNVLNEKISPKISGYDTQGSFEIDSFEFAKKIAPRLQKRKSFQMMPRNKSSQMLQPDMRSSEAKVPKNILKTNHRRLLKKITNMLQNSSSLSRPFTLMRTKSLPNRN